MLELILLFIIMTTIIILHDRKIKAPQVKKYVHVDLYSPPIDEHNKWILIRSVREWNYYLAQYGMPDFIHFGANLGTDRKLGKDIISDIITKDKLSGQSLIHINFSFNVNSSLRLYGDKFYIELNEYLVTRELLAA